MTAIQTIYFGATRVCNCRHNFHDRAGRRLALPTSEPSQHRLVDLLLRRHRNSGNNNNVGGIPIIIGLGKMCADLGMCRYPAVPDPTNNARMLSKIKGVINWNHPSAAPFSRRDSATSPQQRLALYGTFILFTAKPSNAARELLHCVISYSMRNQSRCDGIQCNI